MWIKLKFRDFNNNIFPSFINLNNISFIHFTKTEFTIYNGEEGFTCTKKDNPHVTEGFLESLLNPINPEN